MRKITSCGGVLYKINNGEISVCICRHAKHGYTLPKGGQKEGESLIDCSRREVMEETGHVVGEPNQDLGTLRYIMQKDGEDYEKTVYFYGFKVDKEVKNKLTLEEDEKIEEGLWCSVVEAIKLLPQPTEQEMLKKLMELLSRE